MGVEREETDRQQPNHDTRTATQSRYSVGVEREETDGQQPNHDTRTGVWE